MYIKIKLKSFRILKIRLFLISRSMNEQTPHEMLWNIWNEAGGDADDDDADDDDDDIDVDSKIPRSWEADFCSFQS